jgi:two-component system chemotaxis response regulator CheY
MRILLVDETSAMRRIAKNILANFGYTDVDEAVDGQDALRKLALRKYDLVLMDWNMPNLNGIETLKRIKATEAWKAIPVVMVTWESEKCKVMEALRAGAANYMVKPIEPERLREKIGMFLK